MTKKNTKKSIIDKLYEKALSVKRFGLADEEEELDKTIDFLSRNKGFTKTEVLKSLDISSETLKQAANKIGYKFKKPSIKTRLLELDASQFTSKELAEMIGCTAMAVTNSARMLEIKLKKAER